MILDIAMSTEDLAIGEPVRAYSIQQLLEIFVDRAPAQCGVAAQRGQGCRAWSRTITSDKERNMSAVEKLALCITLLPTTSCFVDDPGSDPHVAQRRLPVEQTDPCEDTPWGDLQVSVDAEHIDYFDRCALFDGDTETPAVIAGTGSERTLIKISFLESDQILTGFHTHVIGSDGATAGHRFTIETICDQHGVTFPDYRGRANKTVALAFRSLCTTNEVRIRYQRADSGGDQEVITELTPIVYGAQPAAEGSGETPLSGDHYNLLSAIENRCEDSVVHRTASITSLVTGAPVGAIELHRAQCTKHPSGTPVNIYFARARNTAGLWNGEIGSVYLKLTTAGGTFQHHKSKFVTLSTNTTSLRSNVWVQEPGDADTLSVTACGTSYPTATSTTAQASSSGCTAAFTLP